MEVGGRVIISRWNSNKFQRKENLIFVFPFDGGLGEEFNKGQVTYQ